jgi:hypothetical protein
LTKLSELVDIAASPVGAVAQDLASPYFAQRDILMTDASIDKFRRIVEIHASALCSEEDVKINVVLPLLRALGYESSDFNYEGRTGRGYVDIVGDRFPTGIVVETKSPRTKLDKYIEQLELYVFHKHRHDRAATVAILTDGDVFRVYGLTEALRKGSLASHQIYSFTRQELANPSLAMNLCELLSKQSNQSGTISSVINRLQQEDAVKKDRGRVIQAEISTLSAERKRIDSRLDELRGELNVLFPPEAEPVRPSPTSLGVSHGATSYMHPASPEILRLLAERNATSREAAVNRNWLDQQLIGHQGIRSSQAVSFGIIELRDTYRQIADEKKGRDRWVWLLK